MSRHGRAPDRTRARAFTLLELLAVLLVLALLAGLAWPTLARIRPAADRARTLTRFAQWSAAIELFRQEYGHYPVLTTGANASGRVDPRRFFGALTGRDAAGRPLAGAALSGNVRGLRFLSLGSDGWVSEPAGSAPELLDGFGNSELIVLVDADESGRIEGDEYVRQSLRCGRASTGFTPARAVLPESAFPAEGIAGPVAFYSAGAGEYVFSWK